MSDPILQYWTPEDCLAGLCTEYEIGKRKSLAAEARRVKAHSTLAAVKALVTVAEQDDDLAAKVWAARTLLNKGYVSLPARPAKSAPEGQSPCKPAERPLQVDSLASLASVSPKAKAAPTRPDGLAAQYPADPTKIVRISDIKRDD
jgi:hypothetical protein